MRMELHTGVCGICSSKSLVLNSEDSEKYHNLICSHFQNEFIIPNQSKPNCSFCTTCIYHITLINSKKDYFLHRTDDEEIGSNGKCNLCKETIEVFSTADSAILDKCKPWISEEKKVRLCASCFFLIEIRHLLKDFCLSMLDDQENHTPKQKGPISRRKSFHEARIDSHMESIASTSYEQETEETSSNNLNESSTIFGVHSTPIQGKKRRRSKNLEELLDEESKHLKKDIQNIVVYTRKQLTGFNLSNILNFAPLSHSNVAIKDEYKEDKKMYDYIPFVKMNNFENESIDIDRCNYVCSVVPQRPMIKVRRTPPIKIKSIKNVFSSREKKNIVGTKDKPKSALSSEEELSKYKLVVMVERMKLPTGESSENASTSKSEDHNNITKEVATPKKKKRVHFNDTPTIIISDDAYPDDLEQRNKLDESKNKNIRSIMVVEQRKVDEVEESDENTKTVDEQSDSEELITLNLDSGSDDESNEDNKIHCLDDEEEEILENKEENSLKNVQEHSSENLILNCGEQGDKEINEDVDKDDNTNNENEQNDEHTNKADNSNDQKEEGGLEDEGTKNSLSERPVVHIHTNEIISDFQETDDEYYNNVLTQIEQLQDVLIGDNTSENETAEKQECNEEAENNRESEKDSLDGFEVIDEENEEIGSKNDSNDKNDHVEESSVKEKVEKPSHNDDEEKEVNETKDENIPLDDGGKTGAEDNLDDIDMLVKKYCRDNLDKVSIGNDQVVADKISLANQNEKEVETLNGDGAVPEKHEGIEDPKSSVISYPISEEKTETSQSDEDFGSLIDEVQKCLSTSTKESLNETEDTENQKDTEPNADLLDILNSSFDENSTSPKENINSNKNLKRKKSDDEIEKPDYKRGKMDIS